MQIFYLTDLIIGITIVLVDLAYSVRGWAFFFRENNLMEDVNSRPFKDIENQIIVLEKRGLKIENRSHTQKVLLKENYYCVINGYKTPFLQKDSDLLPLVPEKYQQGTRFSEIYNLYCMDKELRGLLLKYILKFETKIKSLVAYYFSEAHPEKYGYLHFINYSQEEKDLSDVLKNIQKLSNKIEIHKNKKYDNSIKHYINNHKNVPLWVLVNFLTFGELQYLFLSLEDDIKEKVCKTISMDFKAEHKANERIGIEELKMILKTGNLFRNVCAHDEVLYNYKMGKKFKASLFSKYFENNSKFDVQSSDQCKADLFTMVSMIKLVSPNKDFKELIRHLERIFRQYRGKYKSISFDEILESMGLESNWKEQLNIKKR